MDIISRVKIISLHSVHTFQGTKVGHILKSLFSAVIVPVEYAQGLKSIPYMVARCVYKLIYNNTKSLVPYCSQIYSWTLLCIHQLQREPMGRILLIDMDIEQGNMMYRSMVVAQTVSVLR